MEMEPSSVALRITMEETDLTGDKCVTSTANNATDFYEGRRRIGFANGILQLSNIIS